MLSKNDLAKAIVELMEAIPFYDANESYPCAIDSALQDKQIDLKHHIQVMVDHYILSVQENGVDIESFTTIDSDEALYWMLYENVRELAYFVSLKRHEASSKDDYNIRQHKPERGQLIDEAFEAIGGQYREWHRQGDDFHLNWFGNFY